MLGRGGSQYLCMKLFELQEEFFFLRKVLFMFSSESFLGAVKDFLSSTQLKQTNWY